MEFLPITLIGLFAVLGPWIFIVLLYDRVKRLQRRIDILDLGRTITAQKTEPVPSSVPPPVPSSVPSYVPSPVPSSASVPSSVPSSASVPSSVPSYVPSSVPSSVPSPARTNAEWEMLIGGKLLNRIGALAIVLAVIFFLKYAFDNDLIPPIGRVMIGFAAGSALMYAAHRWMKKGLDWFCSGSRLGFYHHPLPFCLRHVRVLRDPPSAPCLRSHDRCYVPCGLEGNST